MIQNNAQYQDQEKLDNLMMYDLDTLDRQSVCPETSANLIQELSETSPYKPKKKKKKLGDKNTILLNVGDTVYPVIRYVVKKMMKWKLQYDKEAKNWDVYWTDCAVQAETLGRMQPHQKINHFPGMYSLARKNHLGRNLMKMAKQFPENYKFFPKTWLLPAEYGSFKNQFQKGKQITFIIKPEASCQGRGIFLTRVLDDVSPNEHYVAQRYLMNPYLIDGLKFDLRIYVLLVGCDPLRIYIYKEGLARFATEAYCAPNRDNIDKICMHLTNYAINKENSNFVFNEDQNDMSKGHKRSLTSVFQLLRDKGEDVDKLWKTIKQIMIKTFCSVQPILCHHYKSCQPDNLINNMCFEVLGMDVILNHKLKPYLLEVNHTPSFSTETPLDALIKRSLISDSLKLMNVSAKQRNEMINERKEIMQKRVLTGKKTRISPDSKLQMIEELQKQRDSWEHQHLGGFEIVYPIENPEEDYQGYLLHAKRLYEEQTGANIKRNIKKDVPVIASKISTSVQKKPSKQFTQADSESLTNLDKKTSEAQSFKSNEVQTFKSSEVQTIKSSAQTINTEEKSQTISRMESRLTNVKASPIKIQFDHVQSFLIHKNPKEEAKVAHYLEPSQLEKYAKNQQIYQLQKDRLNKIKNPSRPDSANLQLFLGRTEQDFLNESEYYQKDQRGDTQHQHKCQHSSGQVMDQWQGMHNQMSRIQHQQTSTHLVQGNYLVPKVFQIQGIQQKLESKQIDPRQKKFH